LSKKKREKLLLNLLAPFIANHTEIFNKDFVTYSKHYKPGEFPQRQIPEKLAIDGKILFNLTSHKAMQVAAGPSPSAPLYNPAVHHKSA